MSTESARPWFQSILGTTPLILADRLIEEPIIIHMEEAISTRPVAITTSQKTTVRKGVTTETTNVTAPRIKPCTCV